MALRRGMGVLFGPHKSAAVSVDGMEWWRAWSDSSDNFYLNTPCSVPDGAKGTPVRISYMTQPNDHTSMAEVYLAFFAVLSANSISGARYQRVTTRRVIIQP